MYYQQNYQFNVTFPYFDLFLKAIYFVRVKFIFMVKYKFCLSVNIINYYCRCWATIFNKSIHLNIPIELFIQMAFVFPFELVLDNNPFILDCLTNNFNSLGKYFNFY